MREEAREKNFGTLGDSAGTYVGLRRYRVIRKPLKIVASLIDLHGNDCEVDTWIGMEKYISLGRLIHNRQIYQLTLAVFCIQPKRDGLVERFLVLHREDVLRRHKIEKRLIL